MKKGISYQKKLAPYLLGVFLALTVSCEGKTPAAGATPEKAAEAAYKALQKGGAEAIAQTLKDLGADGLRVLTQTKGSPSGDFSYDLNETGDGIVIREYTGKTDEWGSPKTTVIVPETIEGIPVVAIGAAFYSKCLAAVVLPNTIKKIGDDAFRGSNFFPNLPEGLEEIGARAFYESRISGDLVLPASLKRIWASAFTSTNITSIVIPEGVEILEANTFRKCDQLLSVTLPSTLKEIGQFAFADCRELTDIIIPDSITSIKWNNAGSYQSPFDNCGKLKLAVRSRLQALGFTGTF